MIQPNSSKRLIQQATKLIQIQKYQAAIDILKPLSKQLSKNFEVWNLLGIAFRNSGNLNSSEKAFKKCIKLNPKAFGAYNNLGNLYIQIDKIDSAFSCYNSAIKINPQFVDALYNLGLTYLKKEEYPQAIKYFKKIIPIDSSHIGCLSSLGLAYQKQENYELALDYYNAVLDINSQAVIALQNKGVVLKTLEKYSEAISIFQLVISINPNLADAFQNLGSTYALIGEQELARESFEKAVSLEPLNPSHHHWLNMFLWTVDSSSFLASYFQTIKQNSNAFNLRRDLVYKLMLANRYEEATEELNILTRNDSKTPMNYKLLGTLYRKQNKFEDAVKAHLRAVKLDKNNLIFLEELATSYLSLDQAAEALKVINRLIKANYLHQGYWALKAIALRIMNSDEYHYLYNYEKLVLVSQIETPNGFSSLKEFNYALAEELKKLHLSKEHPLDQSLISGTQTVGDLFKQPKGMLKQLKDAFDVQMTEFLNCLPEDKNHPVLSRNQHSFSYSGAWSVLLRNSGFHLNHFHSDGWYSGPYYAELPDSVNDKEQKEGWIKFGEPGFSSVVSLEADLIVKPELGMMVRFPSYMWHGTIPFKSDQTRLVVSLDLEP